MSISRRSLLAGGTGVVGACGASDDAAPPPVDEGVPPPPAPVDPHEPRSNGREPLNVLIVLTDDQRWDSFGFMGHPFLTTPHLDRIARDGTWFSNAFVTTSLCCPSRATMLSGVYAHTHGVVNNTSELAASWPTFATLAQRAGVDTCYIGKWHMGGHTPEPRPGWSTWMSFRGQGQYHYPGGPRVPPYDRGMDFDGRFQQMDGYVTDFLTELAVDWLAKRTSTRPFCMVVGHKACHAPFEPAPRHAEAFAEAVVPEPLPDTEEAYEGLPEWLRRQRDTLFGVDEPYRKWPDFRSWYLDYHRTLLAVDEGVGRLLATLEDRGLLDRTLVLFLSDNGFMHGEKGTLDKRCFYEPSIRVPWLALAPRGGGRGPLPEMVLNLDVAPTVLDALGLEPAPTMQGRSTLPLILGDPVHRWRTDFLYEYFFEKQFPSTPTVVGVRTATHKLSTYHGVWAADELYDLRSDPAERDNLAAAQPQRRRNMGQRLRRLMQETGLQLQPTWGEAQHDAALRPQPNLPKRRAPPGQAEGAEGSPDHHHDGEHDPGDG